MAPLTPQNLRGKQTTPGIPPPSPGTALIAEAEAADSQEGSPICAKR
jgi:hypothetical protein